jgi:hypothetical protein
MDKWIQREPGYKWHIPDGDVKEGEQVKTFCGMSFLPTRQTKDRLIILAPGECHECSAEAYHQAQLARHDG